MKYLNIPGVSEQRLLNRLLKEKVVNLKGCWNWPHSKCWDGYAAIGIEKERYYVHRLMYALMFPWKYNPELKVCHSCDNRACYNWGHLWQGTQKENMTDCLMKGRHARAGGSNGTDWQRRTQR